MPRSKDRLPLKELSKIVLVGLDQQTPTLSTHFFISVLYLIINQAGQVQLQPGLNGGPVLFGKRREVKGQVSRAPYDIQEPRRKLDN